MHIGIDLGGSKIEGIVLADDGSEIARERIVAPRGSYTATLKAIAGLVAAGAGEGFWSTSLGFLAVALATVNVVGGFLVSHRMLAMFRKKG